MTHQDLVGSVCEKLKDSKNNLDEIAAAMHLCLHGVKLTEETTDIIVADNERRGYLLNKFIICKTVEGCTNRTIGYYRIVLTKFLSYTPKQIEDITTDDIRYYLAIRQRNDGVCKTTLDNDLRILRSFFAWASANDVIGKNPTCAIKAIKKEKRVRKPFSDEEQERMRIAAHGDLRLTAIIELLLSTGMRVGELCGLNIEDVNGDEATVFGKGGKERIVYLNARARVALSMYLDSRNDNNEALLVWQNRRAERLSIGRIEGILCELSAECGIKEIHPHRFRRTAAMMALRRGMSVEQVQKMLGHSQIATTLIYAESSTDVIKNMHQRLM